MVLLLPGLVMSWEMWTCFEGQTEGDMHPVVIDPEFPSQGNWAFPEPNCAGLIPHFPTSWQLGFQTADVCSGCCSVHLGPLLHPDPPTSPARSPWQLTAESWLGIAV